MITVSTRTSSPASTSVQVPRPRAAFWPWWVAGIGIVVGLALFQTDWRMEGASLAMLCLAPLMIKLDLKLMPGLLAGPSVFMYGYHLLGYAIGPVGQRYVLGYVSTVYEEGFVLAQWGGVLGLVTFALVYPRVFQAASNWSARRQLPAADTAESDWDGYGVWMAGIAVFVLVFGFRTGAGNRLGGLGEVDVSTSTLYAAFGNVQQVMFFFLGYAAARRRGAWMAVWALVWAAYSLFLFLDGGRGAVVSASIISAMGWVLGGFSARKVLLAGLVAGLVFIPLSGIVNDYRSYYVDDPTSFEGRWTGLVEAGQNFVEETSTGAQNVAGTFLRRVTAESVDRVFMLVPDVFPYAGLEGIEGIVWAVVPRVIAPNRPDLLDGNELAIRFGAALPGTTGSYMPAVGDGYWRFGWAGVAVLYAFSAVIFGAATGVAWNLRKRREGTAMLVLLAFLGSGIWSTTLLANFYTIFWILPKYLIFFLGVRWAQDALSQMFSRHVFSSARSRPFVPWQSLPEGD